MFRGHAKLGVFIMDAIRFSAVVLAIVALLLVWLFLAHMILSRKEDARLEFLLNLMGPPAADASRADPAVQRPAPTVPETKKAWRGIAEELESCDNRGAARSVWQELPVVFAAALRGRAM